MLQMVSYKMGNFHWKKNLNFFLLVTKGKIPLKRALKAIVAFVAVFSIKKVDRDRLFKNHSNF